MIPRELTRRAATLAMATGIAIGLTLSTAASASAASPDVLLSDDGIHFSTGLSDGLFDGLGLLIPGESMKSSLWIKNPTGGDAATRVSIGNLSVPSPAFGTGVSLTTVDVRGATTSTATLSELQRCAVIVPSQPMEVGSVLRIDFTVTMSASVSGMDAQGEAANLDLLVAMRDGEAGAFPASDCVIPSTPITPAPTDPTGPAAPANPASPANPAAPTAPQVAGNPGTGLAYTGLGVATPLAPFAALLIGIGIFFVVRRRRAEREYS